VIRTTAAFAQAFHAARRVSPPLIAVRTPDPASAIQLILSTLKDDETPVLHWDAVRGLAGANEAGQRHASEILGEMEPAAVSMEALFAIAEKIAQDSLLFVANAHRFYSDAAVTQGIWNLRDAYKRRGCTLILLTTMSGCLPDVRHSLK
jgi:hypothetical protein